jgi:hypothetical protein
VIGPIAFDEKGDLRNGPITIYIVKGGKWEPLETVTPGGGASVAAASSGGNATATSGGAAAASGPGASASAPAPDAAKK